MPQNGTQLQRMANLLLLLPDTCWKRHWRHQPQKSYETNATTVVLKWNQRHDSSLNKLDHEA